MKYCELKYIVQYLKQFSYIKLIKRVQNNTIKIVFDKQILYFDLTKSNSLIYIKDQTSNYKEFNAPFDKILQKKFTNSYIKDIQLLNQDKIIQISLLSNLKYKQELNHLIFEFTGKKTNIIITNENYMILEALHHIDQMQSIRVVEVGTKYILPPKPNFVFKDCYIEDTKAFLKQNFINLNKQKLNALKATKIAYLSKEIDKIKDILNSLKTQQELMQLSNTLYEKANILLANIYRIKNYQKEITLKDFANQEITIQLDPTKPIHLYINELFNKAKKYKQKAKNQFIQEQNLKQKIQFLNKLQDIIKKAKDIDEVEFYLPKKDKNKKTTKKQKPYLEFFYNGYIFRLGRNEKENIYLLKNAKANDFWFHLQNQKSAHLIVLNTKKELPKDIIYKAGEILAKFSGVESGVNIDYTQRKFIKIQNKANVLYQHYKTFRI